MQPVGRKSDMPDSMCDNLLLCQGYCTPHGAMTDEYEPMVG
jgi:hypothetical protein